MRRGTVAMLAAFGLSAGGHVLAAVCLGMAGLMEMPASLLPVLRDPAQNDGVEVALVHLSPAQVMRGHQSDAEGNAALPATPRAVVTNAEEPVSGQSPDSAEKAHQVPPPRHRRRAHSSVRPPVHRKPVPPQAVQPHSDLPEIESPKTQLSSAAQESGRPLVVEPSSASGADASKSETESDTTAPAEEASGFADNSALTFGTPSDGQLVSSGAGGNAADDSAAAGRSGASLDGAAQGAASDAHALSMIAARLAAAADGKCYPRQARRRGIEGAAEIRFCIGRDGQAGEVGIVRTSGSPLLDGAASCVVSAASPFGPQESERCVSVPVRFRLRR